MSNLSEERIFLNSIMEKLEFPEDARITLLTAFDKIADDKVASAWFSYLLNIYKNKKVFDSQQIDSIKVLGNTLKIHEYTSAMILLLCMTEHLLKLYKERGLSEELWLNTIRDLKYKLLECRSRYNIDGTSVVWWYPRFYKMELFMLGRLQFEIFKLQSEFTVGGITLPIGTKTINMHIPKTGTPLNHDEVLESYKMAARWFADEFQDQPMVFRCRSWLLFDWHKEVLPANSNLIKFYNDFKIVESTTTDDYASLALVFGRICEKYETDLPKDTTLRRAYAERVERGDVVGHGHGLFIYKDGEIIND
jgi:hypothetical protein